MIQKSRSLDTPRHYAPPERTELGPGERLSQRAGPAIKRAFDVVLALASLILLSPWFVLIALLIKLDSPGPVFYRGKRIGKDGKPFWMIKFRTMRHVAVDTGPRVTANDDPRITRVGHILRHTKLNELPQFLNVLKGDMSLVGPRPEDPKYVVFYTPEQRRVLSVTPGITSVASVMYRDEEEMLNQHGLEDTYVNQIMPEKLELDLEYIDRRSFLVDLDILFQTVRVVLPRFAQASPQIEELFFGPVQRFIRRHLSWFILDLLLALGAVLTAKFIWLRASAPTSVRWGLGTIAVVAMALTFTLMNQLRGLHHCMWSYASGEEVIDILLSTVLSTALLLLTNGLLRLAAVEWILFSCLFAFVAFTAGRYRKRLVRGLLTRWRGLWGEAQDDERRHLLVVGTGPVAEAFAWQVQHRREGRHYRIVGFVDDDLARQGLRIHGIEILGTPRAIPDLIAKHGVGTVVLTEQDPDPFEYQEIAEACQSMAVQIRVIPDVLQALSESDEGRSRSRKAASSRSRAWVDEVVGR